MYLVAVPWDAPTCIIDRATIRNIASFGGEHTAAFDCSRLGGGNIAAAAVAAVAAVEDDDGTGSLGTADAPRRKFTALKKRGERAWIHCALPYGPCTNGGRSVTHEDTGLVKVLSRVRGVKTSQSSESRHVTILSET